MFIRFIARAASSVHVLSMGFGATAVFIQGASLAICYWLVKNELGADYLGVWALIQSTLAFGRIAEFGLSQSLIHFIPKAIGENDMARAKGYFDTVFICSALVFIIMALALYSPAYLLLEKAIGNDYLAEFNRVFPFAILAFVVVNIGQTGINALVGLQKAYQGHCVTIIAVLLNIIVVYLTVKDYGLVSLAYGSLASGLILLIFGNGLASMHLRAIPFVPTGFKAKHLRTILGVGMSIQFISIFSAIADASAKFFINHFVGIQAVGIYEMANRFILFVRGVFALPQNYLGSYFGGLDKSNPDTLKNAIERSLHISVSLSVIFAAIVVITRIWVGEIWVGEEAETFQSITLLLIVGWFFNVMISPIYYAYLGFGKLRVPIISQTIYGILVFTSCYLVGDQYGISGQVLCITMSLAASQVYMLVQGVSFAKLNLSVILSRHFVLMILLLAAFYLVIPVINESLIANWSVLERFIAFGFLVLLHLAIHITIDSRIMRLIRNRNK